MNDRIQELNNLITQSEKAVQDKNLELEDASREMLQLKDMKLDFEGKLENIDQKEHFLKEEIHTLKDHLKGKDLAIN
jgi:predicted  nucleic acid-binding Zn-ribbon protein